MFSLINFIIAFGGGIFGAALGAVPAFAFVGVLVLVGVAIQAAGGGGDFTGAVAFGYFGPHVGGFAAGVAAAGYAASRGKLDSGRNVGAGLMLNHPDVLLIGGLFGLVGYALNWVFGLVGFPWTDTVALTVATSGIIVRLIWGKTGVMGKVADGQSRYAAFSDHLLQNLVLGLGVGIFSAGLVHGVGVDKGGSVLGFGFSAASLLLALMGLKIPATHHISLPAAVATVASGGGLVWGAIFGILGSLLGEFWGNSLNDHGDTHIDPPAATIATLTSLSMLLAFLGVYKILPLF
jgi:hypothetical protein